MNTSKDAVHDYLNAMFMDAALTEAVIATPDVASDLVLEPVDTIPTGSRVISSMDPFRFLSMNSDVQKDNAWLALLLMLSLCRSLPDGALKSYCLNHCQILLNQWHSHR